MKKKTRKSEEKPKRRESRSIDKIDFFVLFKKRNKKAKFSGIFVLRVKERVGEGGREGERVEKNGGKKA